MGRITAMLQTTTTTLAAGLHLASGHVGQFQAVNLLRHLASSRRSLASQFCLHRHTHTCFYVCW